MRAFFALLLSSAALFLLTRLNYYNWPLFWPDEALFSSPAINLAERGVFGTTVLSGLIPGMDSVTLWNSPLYMLLVSIVYRFTGESIFVMRLISFFLATGVLYTFIELLERSGIRFVYLLLLPVFLACDLTFIRAANTGRMDILTLLLFLLAFRQLILLYYYRDPNEKRRLFLAGLYGGLAVCSHPAGFMILPLYLLFLWGRKLQAVYVVPGFLLPLLAWSIYIIPNLDAFELQFLSQITRKLEMLKSSGTTSSDTGGALKIFLSQYGSQRLLMAGAAISIFVALVSSGIAVWKNQIPRFLLFSAMAILAMVLAGSEAWYAIYAGPVLLLLGARLLQEGRSIWHLLPAWAPGLFFMCSAAFFTYSEGHKNYATAIEDFLEAVEQESRSCQSIYLRFRPDPYFHLRKKRQDLQVLEFVPGKIHYPGIEANLEQEFSRIDCFLLDKNDSWEPLLTAYLLREAARFGQKAIGGRYPLDQAMLYFRK